MRHHTDLTAVLRPDLPGTLTIRAATRSSAPQNRARRLFRALASTALSLSLFLLAWYFATLYRVEFYVRFVSKPESENPLTHLLWKIKAGERIYMRPVAAGVFTVKDTVGLDDPRLRVMVAAGTGSAPFVSMVRSELRRNPKVDLSKWVLLHGASYPSDLGHRDELHQLVENNRLKYWGTVSRPKEALEWKGDAGRVDPAGSGPDCAD